MALPDKYLDADDSQRAGRAASRSLITTATGRGAAVGQAWPLLRGYAACVAEMMEFDLGDVGANDRTILRIVKQFNHLTVKNMNTEVSANGLTAVAPKLLSGKIWVAMFPTSKSLEALSSPFRENIKAFINALKRAGATVSVSATLRPPQRAYLMHFSFLIAHSKQDPRNVPSMNDVNIEWFHGNIEDSIKAAKEMVNAYGIATTKTPPALMSNHISGNAIDMTISKFNGKEIAKQDGAFITVNVFNDLRTIGASYNVFNKIADDLPHWSTTGK